MKKTVGIILAFSFVFSIVSNAFANDGRGYDRSRSDNCYNILYVNIFYDAPSFYAETYIEGYLPADDDIVVIAIYAADGSVIEVLKMFWSEGEGTDAKWFSAPVDFSEGQDPAVLKAFVWSGFDTAEPLSKVEAFRYETATVDPKYYTSPSDGGYSIRENYITFDCDNYRINTETTLFVNGYEYDLLKNMVDDEFANIMKYTVGEVILKDQSKFPEGFESVSATVYDIGKVAAVTTRNNVTDISLDGVKGINPDVQRIQIDRNEIQYSVKNDEGNDIDITDIKAGDIIAFAIEPDADAVLINPDGIDMIITDKHVTGMCNSYIPDSQTYGINGTDYNMVEWDDNAFELGYEYEIALDPFGRIFSGSRVY